MSTLQQLTTLYLCAVFDTLMRSIKRAHAQQ